MKPLKSQTTWLLVADGSRARLVEKRGPSGRLVSVGNRVFAASRAPARDYGSDKPGRTHDRSGVRQTAMEPRRDWHVFEKERFAGDMAHMLDHEAEKDTFDRLVLVAPPKTLGVLRDRLGAVAKGRLVKELHKDLTHLSDHELMEYLADVS